MKRRKSLNFYEKEEKGRKRGDEPLFRKSGGNRSEAPNFRENEEKEATSLFFWKKEKTERSSDFSEMKSEKGGPRRRPDIIHFSFSDEDGKASGIELRR